jgi:folate-binding protein YgfZ
MATTLNANNSLGAARDAVLVVPCEDRATLVVTGSERASWLNGLVTSDLAKLGLPGNEPNVSYGLFVGRNGRILADAFVLFEEARALVAVPRAAVTGLRQHLDHYLVMEDAEVANETEGFATWMLHGPAANHVLEIARGHGALGGSVDSTGYGGALVFAERERATEIAAVVAEAAIERGGLVGDSAAWEWLRLERGVPRFGVDFDEKVYPQEAGLEKVAVSFNKGCYLGQEVVCMLEMRGHVKRKLAGLVLDAALVPARGAPVADEAGAAVGEVTSAVMSPALGKPIAFAMLKRTHVEPGSRLVVEGAGAQVVARPA